MSRAEAGATGRPQQAQPPEVETTAGPEAPAAGAERAAGLGVPAAGAEATAGPEDPAAETARLAEAVPLPEDEPKRPPWSGWEPIVRVAGIAVSIVAVVVTGVLELLLTSLRLGDLASVWRGDAIGSGGGPLLGVSILLAVVANYVIAWFAVSTAGRRWALGPAWAVWTVMMMYAAGARTPEGDYLLGGEDWVALVAILAGSLSFAVYSYRMILKRIPR